MFGYHADLPMCNLDGLFHGGFWIWKFSVLVLPSQGSLQIEPQNSFWLTSLFFLYKL